MRIKTHIRNINEFYKSSAFNIFNLHILLIMNEWLLIIIILIIH